MKKADKKKQQILMHLSILPLASGKQLEAFFLEYQSPEKRVSDCMRELEREGLVEGKLRPIGESKVWRLTKQGRDEMDVTFHPVPFSNRNVDHYLAISSVYFSLQSSNHLHHFEVEPRFSLNAEGEETKTYCPDIFLVWKKIPFFIEVQRSPLSKNSWEKKWNVAERFFSQRVPLPYGEWEITNDTQIIVVSSQTTDVIGQTNLSFVACKSITDIFSVSANEPTFSSLHILQQIEKDIALSKQVYQDWFHERGETNHPPFSVETMKKYEYMLKQKRKE